MRSRWWTPRPSRWWAAIPAGEEPMRLALQPDGRYLWVGDDAGRPAGRRHRHRHRDARRSWRASPPAPGTTRSRSPARPEAFVTNRDAGTVTAIDVRTLEKVKDIATGPLPIAVASSTLSRSIYVADGKTGRGLGARPRPARGGGAHRDPARPRPDALHPGRPLGLRGQPGGEDRLRDRRRRRTGSPTPFRWTGSPTRSPSPAPSPTCGCSTRIR